MDDDQELLEHIQKNLEMRTDMEAEKARNLRKKPAAESRGDQNQQAQMPREDRAQMKEKNIPPVTENEDEVEVIIEEYEDPEEGHHRAVKKQGKNRQPGLSRTASSKKSSAKAADKNAPGFGTEPSEDLQPEEPPRKTKKRKKKKRHLLLKLAVILAVLIFGVHLLLMKLVSGTNYQPYETTYVRGDDVMTSPWVENILVVGTDARNTDENSRSDCMIIVSINRKYGKLVMTSILRDSYVEIPGHGQNRINAAFQFGGADLLIQTIEQNFKIGIDHYVKVDFFSFIKIIDALGGVDIDVDDGEAQYVNMYLCEINQLLGVEQGDGNLTVTGMQTLSGKQALSYSRIRYIGTDFARTGRQREVINAMIKKAKTISPLQLLNVCNEILPELTTDISDSQLSWLLMQAPLFLTYESSECRIPADGTWSNYVAGAGMEVLQLDFDANVEILQEAIYGK
jgi:LCP family protein required for cell wall assembly